MIDGSYATPAFLASGLESSILDAYDSFALSAHKLVQGSAPQVELPLHTT